MKKINKIKIVLLAVLLAGVAVFCGLSLTACSSDNAENRGGAVGGLVIGEGDNMPAPAPLFLAVGVRSTADGENVYTINAVVNPSTLTPSWAIVWENSISEWATGKDTNDYFNLNLSNGDKTAEISKKQDFAETALLIATISSPTGELSVSKKIECSFPVAYEWSADDNGYLAYCTDNNNTLCTLGAVNIASEYLGKPVVGVKDEGFFDNQKITSLVIPNGVKKIGVQAFDYCVNLTSIKLPDTLTLIDFRAFASTGITELSFLNVGSLGECAFGDNLSLTSVKIGSGVSTVSAECFVACKELVSVQFGRDVVKIDYNAFGFCYKLSSVEFLGGKSKVTFEEDCFNGCIYQP